jgi:hypothetical protein
MECTKGSGSQVREAKFKRLLGDKFQGLGGTEAYRELRMWYSRNNSKSGPSGPVSGRPGGITSKS